MYFNYTKSTTFDLKIMAVASMAEMETVAGFVMDAYSSFVRGVTPKITADFFRRLDDSSSMKIDLYDLTPDEKKQAGDLRWNAERIKIDKLHSSGMIDDVQQSEYYGMAKKRIIDDGLTVSE